MIRLLPTDWILGDDLAQLGDADRARVLDWLRGYGVDPDRTRAIRFESSDPSEAPIVVAQHYAQWPIAVGRRGIELRTESHATVGTIPEQLFSVIGPNGP